MSGPSIRIASAAPLIVVNAARGDAPGRPVIAEGALSAWQVSAACDRVSPAARHLVTDLSGQTNLANPRR
jgi:hypothetical protein